MRIAFINAMRPEDWGGVENWMVNVASGLRDRGHHSIIIGRPGSEFVCRAQNFKIPTFKVNMRGDFDPFIISRLFRIFKDEGIEILCTNLNKDLRLGGIAAKLAGNIKVISRKGMVCMKDSFRFRWTYNKLVDSIIVASEWLKSELRKYTWLRCSIEVIPVGVHIEDFWQNHDECRKFLLKEYNLPGDSFIMGTASKLEEHKGHRFLFQAISDLLPEFPNIRLIMIGGGRHENFFHSLAREFGIENHVVFAGYIDSRDNINRHIAGLDLFVLPSLIEPFGQVLVEAMALGRPIVATCVDGVVEVIEDNTSAILVNPAESDELRNAIVRMIQDGEMRYQFGNAGRTIVMNKYSDTKMLDNIERYFKSRISGN